MCEANLRKAVAEARENLRATHDGDRRSGESADQHSNTALKTDRSNGNTLRRLARDRLDLLDKVATGNLTPNAAASEAGFRKIKIQSEPTPNAAAIDARRY